MSEPAQKGKLLVEQAAAKWGVALTDCGDSPEVMAETMLKPGGLLIAPTFCHDETRVSWLMSRLLAITAFPGQRRFTSSALAEALTESGFSVSRSETLPGLIPIGYVQATATTSIREVVDEATK